MKFPFWTSGLTALLLVLSLAMWHVNATYCAFGFGGFQCNDPFLGAGDLVLFFTIALILITPVTFVVLVYRLARWWRNA